MVTRNIESCLQSAQNLFIEPAIIYCDCSNFLHVWNFCYLTALLNWDARSIHSKYSPLQRYTISPKLWELLENQKLYLVWIQEIKHHILALGKCCIFISEELSMPMQIWDPWKKGKSQIQHRMNSLSIKPELLKLAKYTVYTVRKDIQICRSTKKTHHKEIPQKRGELSSH